MTKYILKIDQTGKSTNPVIPRCEVSLVDLLATDPDATLCKHRKLETLQQLIYKHEGVDLWKKFKKTGAKAFDEHSLRGYLNLSKGIVEMSKHNIAHMDLKEMNIIDTPNNNMIMIDFGLSSKFEDVYNKTNNLLPYHYHIYPPEFKVYTALVSGKHVRALEKKKQMANYYSDLEDAIMNDLVSKKNQWDTGYESIKKNMKYIGSSIDNLYDQIRLFIKDLVHALSVKNKTLGDINVDQLFYSFTNKIDVYSLGVVMMACYSTGIDSMTVNCEVRDGLSNIIRGCLHGDPIKRFTPSHLHNALMNLIDNKPKRTSPKSPPPQMKSPSKPKEITPYYSFSPKATLKVPTPKALPKVGNEIKECVSTNSLKDLRQFLKINKLKTSGNKDVLCKRLFENHIELS
jgi:serine/threonine protein kinase